MTEAIINLSYIAESLPSLCIPRVFINITEVRIRQVFDDLCIGKINRIDIKERNNEKGESFKRVYIHFDKWFWNEEAQSARRKLLSGKEIKIVYDNPWFWKVSASKWGPTSDLPHRAVANFKYEEKPLVVEHNWRLKNNDYYHHNNHHNNNNNHHNQYINNNNISYQHRTDNNNRTNEYYNNNPPLLKKNDNTKKTVTKPNRELEDGEIIEDDENETKFTTYFSEDDKKICEMLYGDL